MRKLLVALSILIAGSVTAQTQVARELAPGVFFYFGDELKHRSANCVWVIFEEFVVVIDANYPWAAKELLEQIRKTSDKPVRFVVNTHYHHDHSFGNEIFRDAGATVVSTTEASIEMKTLGKMEWERNYSGQPLEGYTQVYPMLTFDDTLVFDDGTQRLELIKMGPAHTAGDAVAWLPGPRVLVTGDLVVNGNPWGNNVADPHADFERWLNALTMLAGWNPAIVVPGHGEPSAARQLTRQRDYLSDMMQQVNEAITKGMTRTQVIKSVDLSKHAGYGGNKVSTDRSVGAMYDALKKP